MYTVRNIIISKVSFLDHTNFVKLEEKTMEKFLKHDTKYRPIF